MANVIINDTHLANIADAIRNKNGTNNTYKPSEMGSAIENIETGGGGSPEIEDGLLDRTLSGEYYNDRIITLGYGAFYGNENLKTLKLPSATRVEQYAMQGCTALEIIETPEANYLGTYCCRNCTSLSSVDFSSVASTGNYICYGCTNLESIELPVLTRIGANFFTDCTSLSKVILRKSNSITTLANINAFSNTPIENGTGYIYVADNLLSNYKSATNWSNYTSQIKPLSELEG